MASRNDLKPVLQLLRRHCPLRHPVRIFFRRLPNRKLCGCCMTYTDQRQQVIRFAIHIDSCMPYLTTVDTLLHEWAHALDQSENGVIDDEPHRDSWGVAYARVWRAYVQQDRF